MWLPIAYNTQPSSLWYLRLKSNPIIVPEFRSSCCVPSLNGITICPCSADHSKRTSKKGLNKTEKNSVKHNVFRTVDHFDISPDFS